MMEGFMSAYQTQRQGFIAELIADRVGDAAAGELVREWEFEANRRGIDVRDPRFWLDARVWIADHGKTRLRAPEDADGQRREISRAPQ
jgi:hypothetical protein